MAFSVAVSVDVLVVVVAVVAVSVVFVGDARYGSPVGLPGPTAPSVQLSAMAVLQTRAAHEKGVAGIGLRNVCRLCTRRKPVEGTQLDPQSFPTALPEFGPGEQPTATA